MKKILLIFLLVMCEATLFGEYERIVSLAPSVTELLFFIGAGKRVVGVTTYCNYPSEATNLPKIGDIQNSDIEKIAALKPDLIIASFSGNSKEKIERLQMLGFTVLTLYENSVTDIIRNIDILGAKLDLEILPYKRELWKKLYSVTNKSIVQTAMVALSVNPIYSVSTNTFISDVISITGFSNAVVSTVAYPQISDEELLKLSPAVLILPSVLKSEEVWLLKKLSDLRLSPRLIYVDADMLSRPSPRIFDVIWDLNEEIK